MYETPEITSFYGADDFMGTGNSKGIVVIDPVVAVEVAVATVAVAVEVAAAVELAVVYTVTMIADDDPQE